jgi:hypothetical protein
MVQCNYQQLQALSADVLLAAVLASPAIDDCANAAASNAVGHLGTEGVVPTLHQADLASGTCTNTQHGRTFRAFEPQVVCKSSSCLLPCWCEPWPLAKYNLRACLVHPAAVRDISFPPHLLLLRFANTVGYYLFI